METLYQREWPIPDTPRAHVLLLHGYGEHCGRYDRLAAELNGAGIHVHAYDQWGHGRSPGKRGRVDCFSRLTADLRERRESICADAGSTPVFLFGHSMGGLVLAHHLLDRSATPPQGAIFSSPLLAIPEDVSPLLLRLAGVLGALAPWLPVDRIDSRKISRVDMEVAAYDSDPLVYHGPICARTGVRLTEAIAHVTSRLESISAPLLVIHGTSDKLAPLAGSQRLLERAGSTDKTGELYEGGYHELLNDLEGERVMNDIVAWLKARVPD